VAVFDFPSVQFEITEQARRSLSTSLEPASAAETLADAGRTVRLEHRIVDVPAGAGVGEEMAAVVKYRAI